MTRYRIDRAHLMVAAGVSFFIAAACVLVAFWLPKNSQLTEAISIIAASVAGIVLLLAAVLNLRPPTVLTLDPAGYTTRGKGDNGTWKDVEDVAVADGMLRFTDTAGNVTGLELNLVDRKQRAELIRDVYDRLNTANGYRRFDPTA
ncbi:MAG TPA: hypothetical protein PLQ19_07495 [Aeromicrobium sp.]|nr:hypothetical protein [Aeromicrobium sp.]